MLSWRRETTSTAKLAMIMEMNTIIRVIEEAGLREHVKIMIGNAGTTQDFADEIGADGYAQNAIADVRQENELLAIAA